MSIKKLFLFALTFIAAVTLTLLLPTKKTVTAQTQAEPQVLAYEVTPSGFNPVETTISQGKCLILVRNRSGRRDLNFWLARENGNRVSESERQKRDWKSEVHLAPGTYILGETNNPEWKSVIRVTN